MRKLAFFARFSVFFYFFIIKKAIICCAQCSFLWVLPPLLHLSTERADRWYRSVSSTDDNSSRRDKQERTYRILEIAV